MSSRRSGWVDAAGMVHLLPGAAMLLATSLFLWLAVLGIALAWAGGKAEWAAVIGLVSGGVALVPVALFFPLTCVGVGILYRRAWARFLALYLAAGLGGTGLLLALSEGNRLGIVLLAHAALTLGALLPRRSAAEFGLLSRSRGASSAGPGGASGS